MNTPPPVALFSSAEKYMQDKDYQAAINLFNQIPNGDPLFAPALARIGLCFAANNQFEQAWAMLEKAQSLNPANATIWASHAHVHEYLNNKEQVLASFQKALQCDPNHLASHNALATHFTNQGENRKAIAHLKHILRIQPDSALGHFKIGKIHFFAGELKKAIKWMKKAYDLNPDMGENWLLLSHAYFLQGDWTKGFEHYKDRFKFTLNFETQKARTLSPQWQGEALAGKSILVLWEQGLGDSLQNLRYLSFLKERGADVHLCIQPVLEPLITGHPALSTICTHTDNLPLTDYHIPFFEIPALLHKKGEDVFLSDKVPYLDIPLAPASDWINDIQNNPRQKIGIVWQGNPGHVRDVSRSVGLSSFQTLATLENAEIYSLQTMNGLDQLEGQDWLSNLEPHIMCSKNSILALAQAVSAMDVIVCCDTMVCHLAGAMGKDVRLMVSTVPDWRWPIDSAKTPWYPQTTIYHQQRGESWPEVIEQIKADL